MGAYNRLCACISDYQLFEPSLLKDSLKGSFIAVCFKADITGMKPENMEPVLHDAMNFFSPNELPSNILPAHKQLLECVQKQITYCEHGWSRD